MIIRQVPAPRVGDRRANTLPRPGVGDGGRTANERFIMIHQKIWTNDDELSTSRFLFQ